MEFVEVTRFLVCCGMNALTGRCGELAAEFGPELLVLNQSVPLVVRPDDLKVPEPELPRTAVFDAGLLLFMFEFRLLKPNMFE